MSPYLPITPEEIVNQGVDAANAGATVLHLHARSPEDGRPTGDLSVWGQIVPSLRERTNAFINMSASLGSTAEERAAASVKYRPDIATVIVGSMNYARFKKGLDQGISDYKHEWEREFLHGDSAYSLVTNNNIDKIGKLIDIFNQEDIAMEFECYDVGHLYILDYHLNKCKVKRPFILQFLTGILGGIPSDIDHLLHMKRTSERLWGNDFVMFMHGTGPGNMKAATYGAMMGTHVRVGQEDNLIEKPGVPFKSNAAQVTKIRTIMDHLNIGTASLAQTAEILGIENKSAP